MERINKYLARCGLGSRRQCEQLVREGRVTVDGEVVLELATQVGDGQRVAVDGRVTQAEGRVVFAFHKPRGLLCTAADPEGRETIYDALPGRMRTLHYIGRLDRDSEGLMLLTNDGELTQQLSHPSHHVEKEYLVTLNHSFAPGDKKLLLEGVRTPEGDARACGIEVESPRRIAVILETGLKRQIRYMFAALEYDVKRLVRRRIGTLELGTLRPGRWRQLDSREIEALLKPVKRKPSALKQAAQAPAKRVKPAAERRREEKVREQKAKEDQAAKPGKPGKTALSGKPGRPARPTRNTFAKNRKAGAKRWKRH